MKFKNGKLEVNTTAGTVNIPLEPCGVTRIVRAWEVPTNYRENGVFVSATALGVATEFPACEPSNARFIGELELEADEQLQLGVAKEAKLAQVNAACDDAVAGLIANYPELEVLSWPQQVKEAEALAADSSADTPLLSAIATARSLELDDLATRVLAKADAYSAASGALIGRRQAAEDKLDAATTVQEVVAVEW